MSNIIYTSNASGVPETNTFNLEDLRQLVLRAEKEAKAIAEKVLEQARAEAERIKVKQYEQAFLQGKAAGYDEGLARGKKEGHYEAQKTFNEKTKGLDKALQTMLQIFEGECRDLRKEAREELVDLALRVAEVIVRSELEINSDFVAGLVESAVELALDKSRLELRIHPEDSAAIEEFLPALKNRFSDIREVSLLPDEKIERGGCVLSTRQGNIDAQIQTQLVEIRRQLTGKGKGS